MRTADPDPSAPRPGRGALPRLALGALALLATALAGCDNPACVFGGTCAPGSQGGAIGTLPASAPDDGQIVRAAVPTIERFAPNGADADPKTPIVIVFSEAMSAQRLGFAFELERVGIGALPLSASTLIGDGRVLVLFPLQDLAAGDYTLRFRENVQIGDRGGQELKQPADRVVGSFSVPATAPTLPTVLIAYPGDDEAGLPDTTEIDVVFSRPMNASTVVDTSFLVTVGAAPPAFDPAPEPVSIGGLATDTRAFRWISRDDAGERASLGTDVDVTLTLSPAASRIEDSGGNQLAQRTGSFHTLPFAAPALATITSFPDDAIGVSQISGPADLAVEVETPDAQSGDRLGVFLFGVQPDDVPAPITIALFREVALVDPFTTFTFTAAELDLVRTASPLTGRVRDGTIEMAFRVKRGTLESPVRRLDVDLVAPGVQGPLLDLVPPTLISVGSAANTMLEDRTDLRDLVLQGRASEQLRAALVDSDLGSNEVLPGEPPPVVGSDAESGTFLAAPMPAGVLDPLSQPVGYTITVYDRALNASGAAVGTLRQVGAGSNGFPEPFADVTVEVFDVRTLEPVTGAVVWSHEDVAGDVSIAGMATTLSDGVAVVPPALIGSTIITVQATGYDLFTFDGVPTDSLSVPLRPSVSAGASLSGQVQSTSQTITLTTRNVGDTRFPRPGETLAAVGSCSLDTQDERYECNFGPFTVAPSELGGLTAQAFIAPSSALLWTAPGYLRAFGLRLPLPALAAGGTTTTAVPVTALDAIDLPDEAQPVDVLPRTLSTAGWPTLSGAPRIRVEGLVPGLRGPLTVGSGVAFPAGVVDTFVVRAAYPGVADPFEDTMNDALGELVANGTLEPDLFLRAEVVAPSGARAGDRPRLSAGGLMLAVPAEPVLAVPPVVANTGGVALDLSFLDVLPDSTGQAGIHRVTLLDGGGRRWTVWKLDPPDASGPDVTLHLPLVGAGTTYPLAPGDPLVSVSSWSWTSFDPTLFLWTDVEREAERFAHAAQEAVTIP